MAAKRTVTRLGVGAVKRDAAERASGVGVTVGFAPEPGSGARGVICPTPVVRDPYDDERPLATRDTMPAPPVGGAKDTGVRRRMTVQQGVSPMPAPADVAPPSAPPAPVSAPAPAHVATEPPVSALQSKGRYSSEPADDESVSSPPPPVRSRDTLRRSFRKAVRVDDVGTTTIAAAREDVSKAKPRIVDQKRIADAPLTAREAFVLSSIDGELAVEDLVDAAGMAETEVMAILGRLAALGIVSDVS